MVSVHSVLPLEQLPRYTKLARAINNIVPLTQLPLFVTRESDLVYSCLYVLISRVVHTVTLYPTPSSDQHVFWPDTHAPWGLPRCC